MSTPPVVRLKSPRGARRRTNHPWVYSNEIDMDDAARRTGTTGLAITAEGSWYNKARVLAASVTVL